MTHATEGTLVPDNAALDKEPEALKKITSTHQKIVQLKLDLDLAIKAFASYNSLINYAALYWKELPWWLRMGGALVISFTLFTISVAAQIPVLLVMSVFIVLSSFLLEEHSSNLTQSHDRFKQIITDLAELMGSLLNLLDQLHQQFKKEFDRLHLENLKLTAEIEGLNSTNQQLTSQIEELNATKNKLEVLTVEYQETISKLNHSLNQQTELFNNTQKQLEEITLQSKINQESLSEKINELSKMTVELNENLTKANKTIEQLTKYARNLRENQKSSEKNQGFLNEKLEEEQHNNTNTLSKLSNQISQLSQIDENLTITNNHIAQAAPLQKDLNSTLAQLTIDLGKITNTSANATALDSLGVFASQNSPNAYKNPSSSDDNESSKVFKSS